jgi:thiol-disulfide isomerase/thioredoxin
MPQTKKKSSIENRFSRTRKIVNAIRKGFKGLKSIPQRNTNASNLVIKNSEDVFKMDKLLRSPQVTFILIKASWCGHCKNYEPKWDNLTKTVGRNANMVKIPVELQKNSQVLKNVPLDGVPTVLEVRNGVVRAVDLEQANDMDVMQQEVTRPSNVSINQPAVANAIVNENPTIVEEEAAENEPTAVVPTPEMVQLVNKVDTNPRDLGETNGSRANDQAALDLAVPVTIAPSPAPAEPISSVNLAEPSAPSPVPAPIPAAIPAAIPAPAPSAPLLMPSASNEPTAPVETSVVPPMNTATPANQPILPAETNTKGTVENISKKPVVDLSAPDPVAELFNKKAEDSENLINEVQTEAATEAKKTEVKQRGGAKRTRKVKGKLLQFLKALTRKARKI